MKKYIFSDTDTDFSESEGLSSLQISGPPKSAALSQSADESGLFNWFYNYADNL